MNHDLLHLTQLEKVLKSPLLGYYWKLQVHSQELSDKLGKLTAGILPI
jgi:hypothetical protein